MAPFLRIIRDTDHAAEFNMAADNLLLSRAPEDQTATVRIYGWTPPAISIGYLQNERDLLDHEAMLRDGVGWVRRLTGGRAVLHRDDITYSCVFPKTLRIMGGSINESYAVISRCLVRGLFLAGIECGLHDSPAEYAATRRHQHLPCFLSPNRNEIMFDGRKLFGSAQKRTAGAVLQHGSMPLNESFRDLPAYLMLGEEERGRQRELLGKKCVAVGEIDSSLTRDRLVDSLVRGFAEELPFEVGEEPWRAEELAAITSSDRP